VAEVRLVIPRTGGAWGEVGSRGERNRIPAEALRTLRSSSAGHLPPLLLCADGDVRLLGSPPERLLGADATGPRSDHTVLLHPGDTVLFYTDGIVEHGRSGIDEGIA
jgi:hypothetical protein